MSSTPKGKRAPETENNTSPDKRKMKQAKTQAGASATGSGQAKPAAPKPAAAKPAAGKPPAGKKQAGAPAGKKAGGAGAGAGAGAGVEQKKQAIKAAKKTATAAAPAEEDLGSADSASDADATAGLPSQEALQALDDVQTRLQTIDSKFQFEKLLLSRKFNAEKAGDYAARSKVIREQIPDFWIRVLSAHDAIRSLFTDIDTAALAALVDVSVTDLKEPAVGYTIAFTFDVARNSLFSNAKLEKTYRFVKLTAEEKKALAAQVAEAAANDEPAPLSADYAVKVETSAVKFKDPKGEEKYIESFFFQWFDPEAAADDNSEDSVAEIIRNEIWPNPLALYLDAVDADGDDFSGDDDDLDALDGDDDGDDAGDL